MSSAAEELHLKLVRGLGCIVCGNAAIAHHIRTGPSSGMGKKASDLETIPLCNKHHTTGGYGVAIHAGQEQWEENFGTELELLAMVRSMLGVAA